MNVLAELRKLGHRIPAKAPPIPVCLSGLGTVGHVETRRGLYLNSMLEGHVKGLLRDNAKAERLAHEMTGGRISAAELLHVYQLGSDKRDAIKALKSMRGAITSWDAVVNARSSGKGWDYLGTKASQTTVANNWSSFLRTAGNPGAMSFNSIPGPAAIDSSTTGAWPLPMSLGAAEHLYMTNFGTNHATGTNIVLAVDVLQAAGNILTSIVTSQNVTTTTLPRWTGGAGLNMTLEVQTAPGTSTGVPNVNILYVDQSGNAAENTGNITWGATSPAVGRLLPLQDGPMIRFNSGDFGVRSVHQVTFSASAAGAGGNMALIIYKPLLLLPTLAVTSFVERSTPAQIGGIRQLTEVVQGSKPCIGFFVLTSTTSTGVQTYLIETVWG